MTGRPDTTTTNRQACVCCQNRRVGSTQEPLLLLLQELEHMGGRLGFAWILVGVQPELHAFEVVGSQIGTVAVLAVEMEIEQVVHHLLFGFGFGFGGFG